jgi:transcriptional regulator GlxA family with amidase domain
MREHLREPITIEALARVAQMPPEQFGTAFRRATGMSLRQWQMDERVRGAQWLMTDKPGRSLAEIADVCGFSDQSHFSRSFLKMVGLTPTGWLHSLT